MALEVSRAYGEKRMSSDNEELSYDLSSVFSGAKKFVELTAGFPKLFDTDAIDALLEPFKVFIEQIEKSLKPLYELYNPDFFENIRKNFKIFSDGLLLSRLQTFGALEWCNIDDWIKLEDDKLNEVNMPFSHWVLLRLEREKRFKIEHVDRYVGRHFTKEIIKRIEEDTVFSLEDKDADKFRKAMIDFRARRYLDTANLLASLIDAQNIKQELFDIRNDKYSVENIDSKHGTPNCTQGWKAFHIVFSNNFSKYFDGERFNGKGKKAREDGFNKFVNSIKGKMPTNENMISIVALSFCLLKFFEDSDFTHYPNNIPTSINRHWLMHGMYDLEHVTRYDCIKLLLMLNQISRLYAKLKNGEI